MACVKVYVQALGFRWELPTTIISECDNGRYTEVYTSLQELYFLSAVDAKVWQLGLRLFRGRIALCAAPLSCVSVRCRSSNSCVVIVCKDYANFQCTAASHHHCLLYFYCPYFYLFTYSIPFSLRRVAHSKILALGIDKFCNRTCHYNTDVDSKWISTKSSLLVGSYRCWDGSQYCHFSSTSATFCQRI